MTCIVMSLHPEWWPKMLSGEKEEEIRKTAPRREGPYRVYIYLTGTGKIWGHIDVDRIERSTAEAIAARGRSCVSREQLLKYATGKPLYAWRVSRAVALKKPVQYRHRPPQSWAYVPVSKAK